MPNVTPREMHMTATLESVFESINRSVIQLSFRWKIFCQLFDSGPENIALLNASGAEVFCLFQHLALDDVIMALSRLTDPAYSGRDKSDENANIKYLLQNSANLLNQEINSELRDSLARLEGHVVDLRVHRNKALAHADLRHTLQPETLPQVLYDDLEGAMKECRNLMSKLGKLLFARTCTYEVTIAFGRSGSDLLSQLRKAHEQGM
jgi:hypothetical protein